MYQEKMTNNKRNALIFSGISMYTLTYSAWRSINWPSKTSSCHSSVDFVCSKLTDYSDSTWLWHSCLTSLPWATQITSSSTRPTDCGGFTPPD
jgi:hypothetical protein